MHRVICTRYACGVCRMCAETVVEKFQVKETVFTLEDLKTKFPHVDITTVIQCNGNRREDYHYVSGDTPAFGMCTFYMHRQVQPILKLRLSCFNLFWKGKGGQAAVLKKVR
jgi:hypothetical protein